MSRRSLAARNGARSRAAAWPRRAFLEGLAAAGAVGCGAGEAGAIAPEASSGSTSEDPSPGTSTGEVLGSSTTGVDDGSSSSGGASVDGPLNIVFITADDLGWKALEAHGTLEHCPNLRRFASESRTYTRAFNVTSSCSSSRASFATGRFPSEHGVRGLVHRFPELSLPADAFTVARALSEAGYRTAIAGKFHISDDETASSFGYTDVGPRRVKEESNLEFAFDFIARNDEQPFFLELNFTQTHRRGSPRRFPMHEDHPVSVDDVEVPAYWALPDRPEIRECLAGYLSQFCSMDALIGRVLDELRDAELLDTTLVLFVSDNGVSFPNNKTTLYDRGIGSPCVVHDPRKQGGVEVTDLVASIDYAATILDAAGLDPAAVRGVPLGERRSEFIFAEMYRHASQIGMRAVRSDRWKFIANVTTDPIGSGEVSEEWEQTLEQRPWREERPTFELYDLEADPHEQQNLMLEQGDVAQELYDALAQHADQVEDEEPLPPLTS